MALPLSSIAGARSATTRAPRYGAKLCVNQSNGDCGAGPNRFSGPPRHRGTSRALLDHSPLPQILLGRDQPIEILYRTLGTVDTVWPLYVVKFCSNCLH